MQKRSVRGNNRLMTQEKTRPAKSVGILKACLPSKYTVYFFIVPATLQS